MSHQQRSRLSEVRSCAIHGARLARLRYREKRRAPTHASAAWAASKDDQQARYDHLWLLCPDSSVNDGRLFVFLLAHVRIVGAPATCLLLFEVPFTPSK
jgi:hypothetical protein